ncbi:MAG TPA: DNA mismatch repair endonuclease MutL [Bacteroidales bacterium]|nr:DNA mismatch repair endonuclease MutL [Bacteroidales bacterium]
MPDVIQLLPDSVANQIAAGEVIQRPASAVKELLENAVDSGATDIKLYIKDSGRTLIQVIDNGSGMSPTDARLSFERHATSKIRKADDLFAINTLGFRGEALASIAAVSQLQLKTRRNDAEIGSELIVEGSLCKSQQPCSFPVGTSIAVKNLFFNVPARRNFLKSNQAELRHAIEEFQRVALVYHKVGFTFYSDEKLSHNLPPSTLKQRIAGVMGNQYHQKLISFEHQTPVVSVKGFIGKPEFARKSRGDQYFFVNKRFIRNPYLHHAVESAYEELIPKGSYPIYFLYLEVDPQTIDINIHPTKTEVNFQHNQLIYTTLKSITRQAIGKFSFSSAIDFDAEHSLNIPAPPPGYVAPEPKVRLTQGFDPFRMPGMKNEKNRPNNKADWEPLIRFDYPVSKTIDETPASPDDTPATTMQPSQTYDSEASLFQIGGCYIVTPVKSGLLIINQNLAHQRILFEQYLKKLETEQPASQQCIFPEQISLSPSDAEIVRDLEPTLIRLGFQFEALGINTFVITGTPVLSIDSNPIELLEGLIDNYKKNLIEFRVDNRNNLAMAMARQTAIKGGRFLKKEEMSEIVNQLFACEAPAVSPDGKSTLVILTMQEVEQYFR